jgi:hypothetical protein
MSQRIVTLSLSPSGMRAKRKEKLDTLFERLAGREWAQRLLRRLGLDPRQFVLFLGLFRTLSEREEFMGSVGVRRFNIAYIAIFTAALGALPSLILAAAVSDSEMPRIAGSGALPESMFLMLLLFLTFGFVFLLIIREAAIALFNPVEASLLAHSPIHSPTYAAAKIAHVLIAVVYLVLGVNICPALFEAMFLSILAYPGARWFLPVLHLVSALMIGIWTAFIICALYGVMRRLVPESLMKSISMWIQLLSLGSIIVIAIFFPVPFFDSFLKGLFAAEFESSRWTWLPLSWFAEIGRLGCVGTSWRLGFQGFVAVVASVLFIGLGLRSFSGTYLLKTSSSAQRRSWRKSRRSLVARCSATVGYALTRSSLGLAVFCFVSKMIRRDWVFRRSTLTQMWVPLIILAGILIGMGRYGILEILCAHQLAAFSLPHFLALITMALCINLPFTLFSKSSWIYLTAPIRNARPLVRGVFWALWIPAVGLPHIGLVLFLLRFLNWEEALFLAGFNLIVLTFYLALEIRWISKLPFSSPASESQSMIRGVYIQVCGLIAVGIPLMVHQALFEHLWIAVLAAIGLLALTLLVLRLNMQKLEKETLWQLYLMRMGSNQMFRESE